MGAGTVWAEVSLSCYHCQTTYQLENLASGAVVAYPHLASDQVLDLDAPNASRTLCAPIRRTANAFPQTNEAGQLWAGALTGRTAILATNSNREYMQRCGSRKRVPLPSGLDGANRRVLLQTGSSQFTRHPHVFLLTLPSLHRYEVRFSASFATPTPQIPSGGLLSLLLTNTELFVQTSHHEVYAAQLPYRRLR